MTLTTHAVCGAALAAVFRLNPASALVVGVASHYLLDSFPHWDYKLSTAKVKEKNLLVIDLPVSRHAIGDFVKIGFDGLLGFFLAFTFFTTSSQNGWISILAGAAGGVLPDGLQFVYMKFRRAPVSDCQRLHDFAHSATKIANPFWGIFCQALILLFALILGNLSFFIW